MEPLDVQRALVGLVRSGRLAPSAEAVLRRDALDAVAACGFLGMAKPGGGADALSGAVRSVATAVRILARADPALARTAAEHAATVAASRGRLADERWWGSARGATARRTGEGGPDGHAWILDGHLELPASHAVLDALLVEASDEASDTTAWFPVELPLATPLRGVRVGDPLPRGDCRARDAIEAYAGVMRAAVTTGELDVELANAVARSDAEGDSARGLDGLRNEVWVLRCVYDTMVSAVEEGGQASLEVREGGTAFARLAPDLLGRLRGGRLQ